jgi:hypothetical protein
VPFRTVEVTLQEGGQLGRALHSPEVADIAVLELSALVAHGAGVGPLLSGMGLGLA